MTIASVLSQRIFAALLVSIAGGFIAGGAVLILNDGSWYYVIAGILLATSGVQLWRGNHLSSSIYGALLAGTVLWGLWEVSLDFWALTPRIVTLAVLGLWFIAPWTRRWLTGDRVPKPLIRTPQGAAILICVAAAVVALFAVGGDYPVAEMPARIRFADGPRVSAGTDWRYVGNSRGGTRYVPIDQITPANVANLKEIWRYRTEVSGAFKATPLQIDDALYFCAAGNVVVSLDAETGKRRWQFDPKIDKTRLRGFSQFCRGVTYYKAVDGYSGDCPERIITGTGDARMFALNAKTGERCIEFGNQGEVDLVKGLGEVKPGQYFVTSPPTVARGVVAVGGWVADNQAVDMPSGVVRAYDAITGKFAWAWDMGRPGVNTEPPADAVYSRGSPNVWSLFSVDEELGLIYAPTGNAAPDYFGKHRSKEFEQYASSVVALDATNGSVRWSFQTVHHDLWDYDTPSQPVLVDIPSADGKVVPALLQATKRAEIFMLNRRTGEPIAPVEEKPVPQGGVPEDWTAPTQPYSVAMPNFRGPSLTEADMWGLTPLDQLWCRIEFRKMRYEGHFTPPSTTPSLQQPGNAGGFNWGSVSIDEENHLMVVNPLIMSNRVQLIPRDQFKPGMRMGPQIGTPYAASSRPFLSPLETPCIRPPYGRLAVIDLQTLKLLWSRPIGTTNESGPLNTSIGVALPMGQPVTAGNIVTKGGLIFLGGTLDRYFRAFDLKTGKELWRRYMPGSPHATPMSYLAPQSKRQIVVIAVPDLKRVFGQSSVSTAPEVPDPLGGHLIAYALDEAK